jgi:hypothetical protein
MSSPRPGERPAALPTGGCVTTAHEPRFIPSHFRPARTVSDVILTFRLRWAGGPPRGSRQGQNSVASRVLAGARDLRCAGDRCACWGADDSTTPRHGHRARAPRRLRRGTAGQPRHRRPDLVRRATKVRRKGKNAVGLFISVNGFTEAFKEAYKESTPFIMMDGADLYAVLDNRVRLDDLIRAKKRHANETGSCWLPASQGGLFRGLGYYAEFIFLSGVSP